jgi:regulatory protein
MVNKKSLAIEELLQSIQGKKISRLKPQVKDPDRLSVFVDGQFIFGLSKWLAADLGLRAELVLTAGLLLLLKESIIEEQVQRFFMNILSRREHAANELYQKGLKKGFNSRSLNKVLDEFKAKELQSDNRYTAAYVRTKLECGWGPQKIQLYLQKNRIDKQLIEQYLSDIDLTEEEELEQFTKLVQKKKASWAKFEDQKLKEKIYRHLMQKGFKGNRILARIKDLMFFLKND